MAGTPWARLVGDPKGNLLKGLRWPLCLPDILRVPGNYPPISLLAPKHRWGDAICGGLHREGRDPRKDGRIELWVREREKLERKVRAWAGYRGLLEFNAGVVRDDWGEVGEAWPWEPWPNIRAVTYYLLREGRGAKTSRGGALDNLLWWLAGVGGSEDGARAGIRWLVNKSNKFVIWAVGPGLLPGVLSSGDAAVVLKIWQGEGSKVHPNEIRNICRSAWYKGVVSGAFDEIPGAQAGAWHRTWALWDSLEEKSWWLCGGPWNSEFLAERERWEKRHGRLQTWDALTDTPLPGQMGNWWRALNERPEGSSTGSPPLWLRERQLSPRRSPPNPLKNSFKKRKSKAKGSSESSSSAGAESTPQQASRKSRS